MENKQLMRKLLLIAVLLFLTSVAVNYVMADDSFNNTMDKIDRLKGDQNKVMYDKIQPLNNQYCFIKIEIKEIKGVMTKQEVIECADGRKAYDGPSYWELFAQFYYRDVYTPEYCRYYNRKKHAFKSFGKVCLNKDGEWKVK